MLLRRLRTRAQEWRRLRPVILMYHRVAQVSHDPWGLAVSAAHFEEQIAYLRQHRRPMSLAMLAQDLRRKVLHEDVVGITFDDGYVDSLVHAKPVLERYGVPATLFLPTGFVGQKQPFWWDELALMILGSSREVRERLTVAGQVLRLDWESDISAANASTWRASSTAHTARQRAYLEVWRVLKHASSDERNVAMEMLRRVLGRSCGDLDRPMNINELQEMSESEFMQFGGHGVTHASLCGCGEEERRWEIAEGKRQCEAILGRTLEGFAYPFGENNLQVREEVARQGFGWACSTEQAFLDAESVDLMALPRIAVPDVEVAEFARLIGG